MYLKRATRVAMQAARHAVDLLKLNAPLVLQGCITHRLLSMIQGALAIVTQLVFLKIRIVYNVLAATQLARTASGQTITSVSVATKGLCTLTILLVIQNALQKTAILLMISATHATKHAYLVMDLK